MSAAHVHRFVLAPQGGGLTSVGVCVCGATTGPLSNVWKSDEVELTEKQRRRISEAATRRHAVRRARIAEEQRT